MAALRDALLEGLSISSAVSRAREGVTADTSSLVGALASFDRERADGAIEAALALRSVERSVQELLLPALNEVSRRHSHDSAAWAFAAHWGSDWLRRATRLAPPPTREQSLIVGDAARDELDPDSPFIRAFELFCVRAGVRVLSLSARGIAGIGDAVAVFRPAAVVVAGCHLDDDLVARWAYTVRQSAGAVPIAVYRRGSERGRMRQTNNAVLPSNPLDAQRKLVGLLAPEAARRSAPDAMRRPGPRRAAGL